jgi:tetratricopeptide (TPR) repeat protein
MFIEEDSNHGQVAARMAVEGCAREDSSGQAQSSTPMESAEQSPPDPPGSTAEAEPRRRSPGAKWWAVAAASALVLISIATAATYLLTRGPSTVDQIVITTIPSGAGIRLNSRDYGQTPVKIEQLPVGTYTLRITKEYFQPIELQITVTDSNAQPLEFVLKPQQPSESAGLSTEDQIKQYAQQAEESFASRRFASPFEESALHYTLSILTLDEFNPFALEMKERIRQALLSAAETERRRGDVGQAKEIYNQLAQYYPGDREAAAARARLESELSSRQPEARSLARKAEEALMKGNLTEPARESAYYYSRQALAIDAHNKQALGVRNDVRQRLVSAIEQARSTGDLDAEIRQLSHFLQFFDEKQMRDRLSDVRARKASETARTSDPNYRRSEGLTKYRRAEYGEAIHDLQFAIVNGSGTADAIFALAHSYMKLDQTDQALTYFSQVPPTAGDTYKSALGAMGDIARDRGDMKTALRRYREARQLGGSLLYSATALDERMEKIEKRLQAKAAEPTPVSIRVRHLHSGFLGGSCEGVLTVNSTGVLYRSGRGDNYSANLVGLRVQVVKDEMTVFGFHKNPQKFKVGSQDAERFREALAGYQNAAR